MPSLELYWFVLQVVLKALDPSFEIENPYVPYIQGTDTTCFVQRHFAGIVCFVHWEGQQLSWCKAMMLKIRYLKILGRHCNNKWNGPVLFSSPGGKQQSSAEHIHVAKLPFPLDSGPIHFFLRAVSKAHLNPWRQWLGKCKAIPSRMLTLMQLCARSGSLHCLCGHYSSWPIVDHFHYFFTMRKLLGDWFKLKISYCSF